MFNLLTYSGSKTYGDCEETVTWHVFEKPIEISDEQVSVITANFH